MHQIRRAQYYYLDMLVAARSVLASLTLPVGWRLNMRCVFDSLPSLPTEVR
jgi:hypothetical protein